MKSFWKILLSFICIVFFQISAIATPQLKIKNPTLNCDPNVLSGGYSGCTLAVSLSMDDSSFTSEYTLYKFNVHCDATFTYYQSGSYIALSNSEHNSVNIYGTNSSKTLYLYTTFFTMTPVYKVDVSNLSCEVKDYHKYF